MPNLQFSNFNSQFSILSNLNILPLNYLILRTPI